MLTIILIIIGIVAIVSLFNFIMEILPYILAAAAIAGLIYCFIKFHIVRVIVLGIIALVIGIIVLVLLFKLLAWLLKSAVFWGMVFFAGIGCVIYLAVTSPTFRTWGLPAIIGITSFIVMVSLINAVSKGIKKRKAIKAWMSTGRGLEPCGFDDVDSSVALLVSGVSPFDETNSDYKFDSKNIPYGRVNAFLNFHESTINEDEAFYFSVAKSKSYETMREFGMLIGRKGIYVSKEQENEQHIFIPFKGLYGCEVNYEKIDGESVPTGLNLCYMNINTEDFEYKLQKEFFTKIPIEKWNNFFNQISKTHIPKRFAFNKFYDSNDCFESTKTTTKKEANYDSNSYSDSLSIAKKSLLTSGVVAAKPEMNQIFGENRNYMNSLQGGGYAAEYGNITMDRITGKNVINEAQNLDPVTGKQQKFGADKIVDGESIQTKYYRTASDTIGSAFKDGTSIYNNPNGTMMRIEVPRDQYVDSLELMQKRIDSGQVAGAKPGDSATNYVRKGYFT
ncbi:MAG: hypothetical protein GX802_03660, partial [Clostridiales bacterium]|nr:hypothetical protein [Clostridiales bacterium]